MRPFYAIDGTNVQAGVNASFLLLQECEAEFDQSSIFQYFRGRTNRLSVSKKDLFYLRIVYRVYVRLLR